ncbi:MAG: hypothetical protein ABR557_00535 [Pyrinomonadaceae bacterium]
MKFLIIFSLSALALLLIYSRVYPYLQALKKLLNVARTIADSGTASSTSNGAVGRTDSRLIRCAGCGTWVPASRAVGANSASSVYCSRECMEKKSDRQEKKLAG